MSEPQVQKGTISPVHNDYQIARCRIHTPTRGCTHRGSIPLISSVTLCRALVLWTDGDCVCVAIVFDSPCLCLRGFAWWIILAIVLPVVFGCCLAIVVARYFRRVCASCRGTGRWMRVWGFTSWALLFLPSCQPRGMAFKVLSQLIGDHTEYLLLCGLGVPSVRSLWGAVRNPQLYILRTYCKSCISFNFF